MKEVQQLMGKITAFSCFISRSTETAKPIFGALNKGGRFVWTPECEEAFLRLKAMLVAPPVLSRPRPNTKKIEKGALALVTASRRLSPYFQNFGIIVRTDLPIRQVLGKPYLAGRMVVWSVQLSEFDITFESRGHIKAQVLADFLAELTPKGDMRKEEGERYLSVDGSSNHAGSGVGVILEGSTGVLIEQSLHFEFKANNNQAEYKALLAGMRLARELEAKRLTAKSDSKLITG
ncbi:hypothetical protein CR513_19962, partial [Mucuna pruriens]